MSTDKTAAGGKPFHGWSCACDECRGYDERGEPRPGEVGDAVQRHIFSCRQGLAPCRCAELFPTARLVTTPLSMRVNDDFADNLAFMRRGTLVALVRSSTETLWSREVWERPVWFRWYLRPYERRLAAARRKALAVAKGLSDA